MKRLKIEKVIVLSLMVCAIIAATVLGVVYQSSWTSVAIFAAGWWGLVFCLLNIFAPLRMVKNN